MDDWIKELTWSYSSCTSYDHCPYEFYLNKRVNDSDLYLAESNYYAELGIFMHEILAKIYTGEMTQEDAYCYFCDEYSNNISYEVEEKTMKKSFELCSDYLANGNFKWLDNYTVLGVEVKCRFKLNGYKFVGFIDLLLRDKKDGRIVIVDNKSSEFPFKLNGEIKKKCEENFDKYKRQMYLYCFGVYKKYGEFPKDIIWIHFKEGGKFAKIRFEQDEFERAIKWFLNVIKRVESDGKFEAHTQYFYCKKLCDFRASCEYSKEQNNDK